MRSMLIIGLTFFVVAEAVGADKPIPQDTARMEQRRRDWLDWNIRTMQGAYDKVGKKDPRWDKQVRATMDLAARLFSQQVDPTITFDEVNKSAKAAIDAGCDDPLVGYLYNRTTVGANFPGEEEAIRRMNASAKAISASRYPAFRRAVVLLVAGGYELYRETPTEASKKEGERYFDAILALLPESVASEERTTFWEDGWYDRSLECIRAYRKLGMDAEAAYARVDAKLAKHPELEVLRLQVRGTFWLNYGWEARTNAFAPAVPAGGFDSLEKRLGEARKAFNEAWKLRPDDARTAVYMLDIDKSIGGDRATMELWFDRAMKANGDQYSACLTKLDWLDPKWHGTPEEMLAFGRACRETRNWRVGITLLAGAAHFRYYNMIEPAERSKYLSSPEVWSEIKAVYDEYLEHHPSHDIPRSKYATLCYLSNHFPEAHAQFEILGDRLTQWPDFPYVPLASLKSMRDHAAQVVTGKSGAGGAPAQKK
jgi:hypothetical protein